MIIVGQSFPEPGSLWTIGAFLIILLTMLAWVRNLATFRYILMAAVALLMFSIAAFIGYSIKSLATNGFPDNIRAFNTEHMLANMGYSFYTYEAIGIYMPCM